MHYQRWQHHGDPNYAKRARARTTEQRFWPLVQKTSGCWLFTGARDRDGYGQFRANGMYKAHRMAYELIKGPIPKGLVLDHLCDTPSCVNPDHLNPTTNKRNILRGVGAGARNARKTHCLRGHILPVRTDGMHRRCRECENTKKRQFWAHHGTQKRCPTCPFPVKVVP